MEKKKWTLLYIALNILVIVLIGVLDPEIKEIDKAFNSVRLSWLVGGVAFMVLYWIMDGIILNYTINCIHKQKYFWKSFKVAVIGQYYNAVTPFASGGQPAQVYYMAKMGVSGGSASSILIIKFLVYQVVLSLYGALAFILKGIYIYKYNSWIFWFSVVGFIVNAGAVVLLVFLSFNKGFVKGLAYNFIDLLNKIRLIREPDRTKKKLDSHVEDFHIGLRLIKGNTKAIFNMSLMTAVQLLFFFSITFFIYKGLGLNEEKWFNIVLVQALLYLAVSFIPTPGSTGASETGFMIFFRFFFPSNLIFVAMLLWRIISYYLNIMAGIVFIFVDSMSNLITSKTSS
ncbi:MAG: lysylphosphatidylglycerol synthase transmembrane domain-containing protein [Caldicoprobacterales bacterium]